MKKLILLIALIGFAASVSFGQTKVIEKESKKVEQASQDDAKYATAETKTKVITNRAAELKDGGESGSTTEAKSCCSKNKGAAMTNEDGSKKACCSKKSEAKEAKKGCCSGKSGKEKACSGKKGKAMKAKEVKE
jgi:L-2-hydroxyglutarate oxidase LhgO